MSKPGGKGGGARKIGNNKEACKLYKAAGRLETNKKRRLGTRIKNFPHDIAAQKRYAELYGDAALTGCIASRTKAQKARATT